MHSNGWIQLALFIGGLALITANTDQAAFGLLDIDGVNEPCARRVGQGGGSMKAMAPPFDVKLGLMRDAAVARIAWVYHWFLLESPHFSANNLPS